jgi:hypothetical protein
MRNSLKAKVLIGVLLLTVGFVLVAGQVNQAYAHGGHGGWHGGGRYYGGYSWGWYYPYYYYCPYYYWTYCPSYWNYYGTYYSSPLQYTLTVNVNPTSLSGQVTGGGSYTAGSSASFSTGQSVVQVSKDTRYVFSQWSGDYTGTSLNGSVTMDGSKTVTAVYQLQYLLTVTVQPSNAPSPQGTAWYNAGDSASLTVPSQTVGGNDGRRLAFVGWSVDGNSPVTSPLNLQMNAPHTAVAQYKQQFYLTVSTDKGALSGQGWYDAGTYATVNVSAPSSPSYGVNIVFNGWQGGVESSASQSTRVLMDGPKTVVATWRTDSTLLYATVAAVILAILLIAGAGFYSMSQRKQGTATKFCSKCGKPFRGANNYCVICGAPRPEDTKPSNPQTTPPTSEATRQA